MVRPRKVGRRWSFESLEERRLLAGDVTAKIDGGDLVIKRPAAIDARSRVLGV